MTSQSLIKIPDFHSSFHYMLVTSVCIIFLDFASAGIVEDANKFACVFSDVMQVLKEPKNAY